MDYTVVRYPFTLRQKICSLDVKKEVDMRKPFFLVIAVLLSLGIIGCDRVQSTPTPGPLPHPLASPEVLSVDLSANFFFGDAPLNDVDLRAEASGTAAGNISYWFDCEDDGRYERETDTNSAIVIAFDVCDYANPGVYRAKVTVIRGEVSASDTTATISVNSPFSTFLTPVFHETAVVYEGEFRVMAIPYSYMPLDVQVQGVRFLRVSLPSEYPISKGEIQIFVLSLNDEEISMGARTTAEEPMVFDISSSSVDLGHPFVLTIQMVKPIPKGR